MLGAVGRGISLKNAACQAEGGLGDILAPPQPMANSCFRQRGQDFALCAHPVDTGPNCWGRLIF